MVSPGPESLDDLIAKTRQLSAVASTDEQWEQLWTELRRFRGLGTQAFDAAVGLLSGPHWDRALGCHILGTLCNPDEEGWGHQVAVALVGLSEGEAEPEVLWAMVEALHHAADPIGVPVMRGLRNHPDRDIRLAVAMGLPFCSTSDADDDLTSIVETLVELMKDEDPDVRDWATCGVGRQLNADGAAIRAALARRLGDDPEVHVEAVRGLARRRDPQSLRSCARCPQR